MPAIKKIDTILLFLSGQAIAPFSSRSLSRTDTRFTASTAVQPKVRTCTRPLAPSHLRSRLRNLVACNDINCYLDLVWVTYDDLELVAVLIVLYSYASHDCHQTM